MTTPNYAAIATVTGSKILTSTITGTGSTVMEAVVRLHEKLNGSAVEVKGTEIRRVEFLSGGFRVTSRVGKRNLRRLTEDRGSFVSSLKIQVN